MYCRTFILYILYINSHLYIYYPEYLSYMMPLSLSVFNYTSISVLLFSYAVGTSLLDLRQSNPSIFTTNNKSSTTFFNYYGHLLYEVLKNLATSEIKLLLVANMAANCVLLTFKTVLFTL